uniref:Secreted protein n=1 Tax=Triticum urartu TaxID=4572 RepID=A0A8R7TS69_TRIUA
MNPRPSPLHHSVFLLPCPGLAAAPASLHTSVLPPGAPPRLPLLPNLPSDAPLPWSCAAADPNPRRPPPLKQRRRRRPRP